MYTAAIIDYPREDLPKDIWDTSNEELKLQPAIRNEIDDIVMSCLADLDLPDEALIDILIYGSILTNQYNKKTDVDARILLDPEIVSPQYPNTTGDDLFELVRSTIDNVVLTGTERPLNATMVIEGEDTELGKSELGVTENDPIYSFKLEKLLNAGTRTSDNFDPDKEFMKERDEVTDIMLALDNIIRETKTDAIDLDTLQEAVKDVKKPEALIPKIEDKLKELEADIETATAEYTKLKDDRSEGYKVSPDTNRHTAPGNVRYKMLEKYKYIDVLKRLKQILKDGVTKEEISDIIDITGQNIQEVPPSSPTGPMAPTDQNPLSFSDGGMMHGASCPKCGFINPLIAGKSDNFICINCGHHFKHADFQSSPAISTSNETTPYPSDVKIGQSVNLDQIETLLQDSGVSIPVIDKVKEKLKSDPTDTTAKPPQSPQAPEAPNAPQSPTAPESSQPSISPQTGLKPGIPMKQLGQGKLWDDPDAAQAYYEELDRKRADFVESAKLYEEYKSSMKDSYGVILEEMSDVDKHPYRVTWFSSWGPIGHTGARSIQEAARIIWDDLGPNIEVVTGALDELALSGAWGEALPHLLEVHKHNSSNLNEAHMALAINLIAAMVR
jgi:uncharacterized Zn finger protein (UPF0148 family)